MTTEYNQNPLTLEQLRQMDGKPAWVEDLDMPELSAWRLIYWVHGEYLVLISKTQVAYLLEDYGKTWLAYGFEPAELPAWAEAADARCVRLEEAQENANEAAAKWKGLCYITQIEMEAIKRATEIEELYIKLQTVTGITLERMLELFLEGYTLQPPENLNLANLLKGN